MAHDNVQYPWLLSVNVSNFVPKKLWFSYTSTNYPTWKQQMLCLIQSQDLSGFIYGSIAPPPSFRVGDTIYDDAATINQEYCCWRRTDSLIKGWILGSLDENIASTVLNFATATDLWLELENRFHQLSARLQLHLQTGPYSYSSAEQSRPEKDLKNYLPLHRAALRGDWEAAKTIFDQDPAMIQIKSITATSLQAAAGTGKAIHFVKNMAQLLPDESLNEGDAFGNTALHVAAAVGNTAAAFVLINRMPSLLYLPNKQGDVPVQMAALYAHIDTLRYLISMTKGDGDENPFAGISGVRLLDLVIEAEFFDVALYLVDKYPHTARMELPDGNSALRRISTKKSAFTNGLHFNSWERFVASLLQHSPAKIWKCIERLGNMNAFQYLQTYVFESITNSMFTSISILYFLLVPNQTRKVKDKYLRSEQALELVKRICIKMEESLSHEEAWEIYRDAMGLAAQFGIREVVEVIVETFPAALYSTIPGSNQHIFHVAVENRSEDVYNLIYQMSDHKLIYPQLTDSYGNNLLHLAGKLAPPHKLKKVRGAALQMQRELQWYKEVENFMHPYSREQRNLDGKSPQMVFTEEHKELKAAGEKWMKDTANSFTISAALIATVMFAAAITVPGGNDDETGLPIFSAHIVFDIFAVSVAISLFTSITSLLMFLSILTSRYAEKDFLFVLPKRLIIGLSTLFLSVTFMMVAFSSTILLLFGQEKVWVLIPVTALACLPVTLFVLLQSRLLVELVCSTYCPGIFGKKSNRPFY